jgi:ribosomal protein S18 acetylase RimI-like enzyme
MQIVKAELEDIPVIYKLASEIWRQHYPGIISTDQIEYMLNQMYSAAALEDQLAKHAFFLVSADRTAIGFYSFYETAPASYYLSKLYIKHNLQRKTIGEILINHLKKQLQPGSLLKLNVNRKNYKAINFYFKMGFIIEDVQDIDIGNGYFMNDFVMKMML